MGAATAFAAGLSGRACRGNQPAWGWKVGWTVGDAIFTLVDVLVQAAVIVWAFGVGERNAVADTWGACASSRALARTTHVDQVARRRRQPNRVSWPERRSRERGGAWRADKWGAQGPNGGRWCAVGRGGRGSAWAHDQRGRSVYTVERPGRCGARTPGGWSEGWSGLHLSHPRSP